MPKPATASDASLRASIRAIACAFLAALSYAYCQFFLAPRIGLLAVE
jgi:hypothetical protein